MRETWLHDCVVTGVFARVIQSLEDRCLGCARRSLERDGWPTRSWQQDGLLVEDGAPIVIACRIVIACPIVIACRPL